MGADRSPEEILEELGERLDVAYKDGRPARRWPLIARRRNLVAALAAGLLGVSTAAATNTIFSPAPPLPRLSALAIDLASATTAGSPWALSAARCSGPSRGFSLLLKTPAGGAGGPCTRFSPHPAPSSIPAPAWPSALSPGAPPALR